MFTCKFCGRECINNNSLRNHERLCKLNPDRQQKTGGKQKGFPAWNKGLNKKEFPSLARPNLVGKKFGSAIYGHTETTKRKISEKLSTCNKGGRCKWYNVAGQLVQGTWERDIALKLTELGVKWKKIKTNSDTVKYCIDGKERSYTPDFYLEDYKSYLEVKGYWWGNDKKKMEVVMNLLDNIYLIQKEEYDEILQGELVWSLQRQTENL